jgi:hypothetical protein
MAPKITGKDLPFGIKFVDEESVPPAPRKNDRNPALWKALTDILQRVPNQWAMVREYDKPGSAAAKASNINNGKNEDFPSDVWEARYEKDDKTSRLFMRYTGPAVVDEPTEG